MCVTFVYLNTEAVGVENSYQLILLNNRDESFDRPTSFAAWEQGILAGRDEAVPGERGGTWLGMKEDGKIGVLLSMLQRSSTLKPNAPTRGKIVHEYLKSECSARRYGEMIAESASAFNGFNLLLFDRIQQENGWKQYELVTLGNSQTTSDPETLGSGIYGFGNSSRLFPFKKVEYGTELFKKQAENIHNKTEDELLLEFVKILRDNTCHHPDEQIMSQTEQREECSKAMSQLFYRFPYPYRYGTRSHTIIMINGMNRVVFFECSLLGYQHYDSEWAETKFVFTIDK